MIRPVRQNTRIQAEAQHTKANQHAAIPLGRQLELVSKFGGIEARAAWGKAQPQLGQTPVHRHGQRTVQQEIALAVGVVALAGPGAKFRSHRCVDRIPAKVGQPHQGRIKPPGQFSGCWRHIGQHQQRAPLLSQPGLLHGPQGREARLQRHQGLEGGIGISA